MISFNCPRCETSLLATDRMAGTAFSCTACGHTMQVPDTAANAVGLGGGERKRRGFPLWVLAVIPAGVLLLFCAGGTGFIFYRLAAGTATDKDRPGGGGESNGSLGSPIDRSRGGTRTAEGPPVATVQADDLYEAYHENEARADGLYTDKRLEVIATFHPRTELYKPHKAADGHYFLVLLHTGQKKGMASEWVMFDPPRTIVVHFRDSEIPKVGRITPKEGDTLTVQGSCLGLKGSVWQDRRPEKRGMEWTLPECQGCVALTDAVLVAKTN